MALSRGQGAETPEMEVRAETSGEISVETSEPMQFMQQPALLTLPGISGTEQGVQCEGGELQMGSLERREAPLPLHPLETWI